MAVIDYPEGQPCWAPGAADRLAELLSPDDIVTEWGSGQSTIWLAERVDMVRTVEHDPKWVKFLQDSPQGGIYIDHIPYTDDAYVNVALRACPPNNVWVIDGYRRIDCLALVCKKVTEGQIVVLDDALDYAEFLLQQSSWTIERFSMPHPHAGLPCQSRQSRKNKLDRNTVRTHAPATKETWVCVV